MSVGQRHIYVVRHAHREDVADPTWPARSPRPYDPPLSVWGHRQASCLAAHLRGVGVTHLFASPFLRALDTAAPIAEALELKIRVEPGLCELFTPQWFPVEPEIHDASRLAKHYPRVDTDYPPACLPAWPEDQEATLRRGRQVTRSLLSRYDGDLLLVTHGGFMNKLVAALLEDDRAHVPAPYACLVTLREQTGGWTVVEPAGDTRHLPDELRIPEGLPAPPAVGDAIETSSPTCETSSSNRSEGDGR